MTPGRRASRAGRGAFLIALASLVALAGCRAPSPPEAPAQQAAPSAQPPAPPSAAAAPGDRGSLYDLKVELEDQRDEDIELDTFRGHVTLVSMFYASCPAACPTLISDLKRIEAALEPSERERLRVLLISMDREKDDPESMRALAERHGLDLSRWTLAEPEEESDIRAIAAALGIKYRRLPDGNISHSTIITILRPDGGLDLAVEGLARDPADVVARLKALLADQPS